MRPDRAMVEALAYPGHPLRIWGAGSLSERQRTYALTVGMGFDIWHNRMVRHTAYHVREPLNGCGSINGGTAFAHEFARAFLMPPRRFLDFWKEAAETEDVAAAFLVEPDVARAWRRRLNDLPPE